MTLNGITSLPPDPSVPGSYWIARREDGFCDMWDWLPDDQEWWRRTDDGDVCSPEEASRLGYTLASPHPIPSPVALEAVWMVLIQIETQAKAAELLTDHDDVPTRDEQIVLERALRCSAAMLRAALETKETT